MGVHLDPEFTKRTPFRTRGQIYHYINSLFPLDGTPSHLQLYFYNTEHEAANRRSTRDKLELPIINHLISVLETNPYSKFFRGPRERDDNDKCEIRLKADPKIQNTTMAPPIVGQVASIWNEAEDATECRERDILVHQHDGHSQRI